MQHRRLLPILYYRNHNKRNMSSKKRTNKRQSLTNDSITNARNSSEEYVAKSRKQSTDATVDYSTCNAARLLGKIAQGKGNPNGNMTTRDTRRKSNNSSTTRLQHSTRNNDNSEEEEEDENKNAKNANDEDEENDNNEDEQNGNVDEEDNANDNDQVSNSGFSNGSDEEQDHSDTENDKRKSSKRGENGSDRRHKTKPIYEEELQEYGRTDSVAQDIQLIKGVLPDLFAVLKFLECDDDLVYKGTICRYFFKKLQVAESKQYEWWKRNSHAVRKSIDGRRASVSNLIKRSFMGMYAVSLF